MNPTPQKVDAKHRQANFFHVCGNCKIDCCMGARPPLTPKRRAIIEKYLAARCLKIGEPFEKSVYSFPREIEGGYCVFFNKETKRCEIHLVKPETCVAGPVTFDINLKTGKIEWFLKTEKICPLAGVIYKNQEALQSHLMSAKRELFRLVHDLDAESLLVILKIEEPDTFKIGEDDLDVEVLAKLKTSV